MEGERRREIGDEVRWRERQKKKVKEREGRDRKDTKTMLREGD